MEKYSFKNAYKSYQQALENQISLDKNNQNVALGFPEFTNHTINFIDTLDHIFYSKN